mmetsp:Transcript_22981/g.57588  ORF Transcript_22981/g.57588 Transcript_22981/m.57588 type:complete len:204 (-) Transcript_22981:150-761(-)
MMHPPNVLTVVSIPEGVLCKKCSPAKAHLLTSSLRGGVRGAPSSAAPAGAVRHAGGLHSRPSSAAATATLNAADEPRPLPMGMDEERDKERGTSERVGCACGCACGAEREWCAQQRARKRYMTALVAFRRSGEGRADAPGALHTCSANTEMHSLNSPPQGGGHHTSTFSHAGNNTTTFSQMLIKRASVPWSAQSSTTHFSSVW